MDENKGGNASETVVETPTTVVKKDESQSQSKSISKYEARASMSTLNLFDEKQLAAAEAFLGKVIKSKTGGITSVADGLGVLMRANDLGLPFSTCIEHIHVINGKTGIDIHIVKALLSRAGCTWSCIKDYQPLYEYTDGINVYVDGKFPDYVERCKDKAEADKKASDTNGLDIIYIYPVKWYKGSDGNIYRDYQLNTTQFGIAINPAQVAKITADKKVAVIRIPNNPVDYVTEYEITRTVKGKEVTAKGRFSYTEAQKAGLFEKDTYVKYDRTLIGHRAFTYAAREVASDILFGVMETTELKIVEGKELSQKDIGSIEEATYSID